MSEMFTKKDKIRNQICHRFKLQPSLYNAKNTAKWMRMWIKTALLLELNEIADAIENLLHIFMTV
jgi:hypothetical protein